MVCGKKTEVFSRAVGYYRPVDFWNLGKRAELKERIYFAIRSGSSEKELAR